MLILKVGSKKTETLFVSQGCSHQLGDSAMENMKFYELGEKIAKIMEEYKIKVYDLEFINELIKKTIERDEKECSY